MQRFLFTFCFFLSCGFNSGYAEILRNKNYQLNGVFTRVNPLVNSFRCNKDEECQTLILESKCIKENCKCEENKKILSSDASKCLPRIKEFGSPCEDNVQCSSILHSGGICQENKCSCKSGYHYLRGKCWKNVDLDGKCVRDEQCFSSHQYVGLKCEKQVCKCRENYYKRLGSCRRKRSKGESCNLDEDCPGITCSTRRKCGETEDETFSNFSNTTSEQIRRHRNCYKGMFQINGECFLELGMNCTKNSDCGHIKNALCLDNSICACEPALYVASEDNRKCLQVTRGKVNDISKSSCQTDSQCEVFGPNTHCQNKRCACKDSYFETDSKFCWKIKSLTESCEDNRDCYSSVTHAECKDTSSGKQCLCQNSYHQKGSECVPDALKVGDPCEKDEECLLKNTFCNATNVCACRKQFYLENGECKPGVGTICVTNEDCANLKNTECKIGENWRLKQCLCKMNHTHSVDYKYCLPVANHQETCEESFQCEFYLGNLRECKNNSCECLEGAHYSYGKCHKSKFVGESCSKLPDCFSGNDTNSVICHKGICRCNYDYELNNGKICVKTNSAQLKSYSALLTSLLLFLVIR